MKVETKQTKKEFQPIEMTITFESEEELCNMWHRLNATPSEINEDAQIDVDHVKFKADATCHDLWDKIDETLIALRRKY